MRDHLNIPKNVMIKLSWDIAFDSCDLMNTDNKSEQSDGTFFLITMPVQQYKLITTSVHTNQDIYPSFDKPLVL